MLKIEYVVVRNMGMKELGTLLYASQVLWVYESSEVITFDIRNSLESPLRILDINRLKINKYHFLLVSISSRVRQQ